MGKSARQRAVMPHAEAEAPCTIVFGHNATDRKVCMLLSTPTMQLIFSPEDAEDVAAKLRYYAAAARGKKPA